jgi:hypothetical protein
MLVPSDTPIPYNIYPYTLYRLVGELQMLVPTGLCLVGAYTAAADESPAALAQLLRRLDKLLPPQLVRAELNRANPKPQRQKPEGTTSCCSCNWCAPICKGDGATRSDWDCALNPGSNGQDRWTARQQQR